MNPKVVHVKAVKVSIEELRERLLAIFEECGCDFELHTVIKDTIIASCKTEEQIMRLNKLKTELEKEGKVIIISQEGL